MKLRAKLYYVCILVMLLSRMNYCALLLVGPYAIPRPGILVAMSFFTSLNSKRKQYKNIYSFNSIKLTPIAAFFIIS